VSNEPSVSVKVHGLDGGLVEPDWAPLTLAELRALLANFPQVGEPIEIAFASPRPFSAAGLVRTANGTVFVKRHARSIRDREGLLEEHRLLAYLLEHGASVPRVLADTAGETAIESGMWTYEVHEPAAGIDVYGEAISWTPFLCSAHARAAGQALARLHRAAEGFNAPRRKVQPLVARFTIFAAEDPAVETARYLATRPTLANHAGVRRCAEQALQLLAPFHDELRPLLPSLAPLWTHNDLHGSNLLWSDGTEAARVTATIDFGLSDRTNSVHDIAHAIERNIVEWLTLVQHPNRPDEVPVHFDHLHALLTGYESVRKLSAEEAAALAPMMALCHAEFALSEADYFLGVLRSEQHARAAYDGWLVGHASWFHSAAGTRLLDALRCWAHARPRPGACPSLDSAGAMR
jgi:Ser/Thr protein kinase RdoA (MazF antagonist)